MNFQLQFCWVFCGNVFQSVNLDTIDRLHTLNNIKRCLRYLRSSKIIRHCLSLLFNKNSCWNKPKPCYILIERIHVQCLQMVCVGYWHPVSVRQKEIEPLVTRIRLSIFLRFIRFIMSTFVVSINKWVINVLHLGHRVWFMRWSSNWLFLWSENIVMTSYHALL